MSAVLAALQDKAEELLALLRQSQVPTASAPAAIITKTPLENGTGHSANFYFTYTPAEKSKLKVVLLNAKKEAVATPFPEHEFPAKELNPIQVTLRVPAGYSVEAIFAAGAASEGQFVTGA
jgi:hypothetical protein